MKQGDLFDITENRHGGNAFSVRANLDTAPRKENQRDRIYKAFVAAGPQGNIAERVYQSLGITPQTGSARCSELKRDGRLLRTKREADTATGSAAQVLVADVFRAENPDIIEYAHLRGKN